MIYRLVTQQAIKKWNATDHETYPLLAEALWRSLNETPSLQSEVASILPLVGKPLFHLLSQAITQSSQSVIQESIHLLPYEVLAKYPPDMVESLLPPTELITVGSLHAQIASFPFLLQTILHGIFIQHQRTTIETEIQALLCFPISLIEPLLFIILQCLDSCLRFNSYNTVIELFVTIPSQEETVSSKPVITSILSSEQKSMIESTLILLPCTLIQDRSDLSKSSLIQFSDSLYRVLRFYNEKSSLIPSRITELDSTQEQRRENAIQVIQGIGAPILVELSRMKIKVLTSTPFLDRFVAELTTYCNDNQSTFGLSLILFYCRYLGEKLDESHVPYLFDRLLPSFLELAQKPVCESIECSFEKVIINSFPND